MASMDGPPEVWYWLVESIYGPVLDEADARQLATVFTDEEVESIEYKLAWDFDEEEHSWRDYRNSLWYSVTSETERAVDAWLAWKADDRSTWALHLYDPGGGR